MSTDQPGTASSSSAMHGPFERSAPPAATSAYTSSAASIARSRSALLGSSSSPEMQAVASPPIRNIRQISLVRYMTRLAFQLAAGVDEYCRHVDSVCAGLARQIVERRQDMDLDGRDKVVNQHILVGRAHGVGRGAVDIGRDAAVAPEAAVRAAQPQRRQGADAA